MAAWDNRGHFFAAAAEAMGITSARLKELKLVDGIIEEPLGGAHRNPGAMVKSLKLALTDSLERLEEVPVEQSEWQGECFVFDNRVAVNHNLEKGQYEFFSHSITNSTTFRFHLLFFC